MHVLETSETARFAPGGTAPQALAHLFEEAQRVIDTLDGVKPEVRS